MSYPHQELNDRPRFMSNTDHGQEVFDVLADATCRRILQAISDRPMTAAEVATIIEQPISTVYRKLNRLSRTTLVTSTIRISTDGHHSTQYACEVDRIHVQISTSFAEVLNVDILKQTHDIR